MMDTYNLQAWTLLIRAKEMGSVAKASESLDLDPATAGRLIQRLEQSIGRQLYIRKVRPFQLTVAGELAVNDMQKVIKDYEVIIESVRRDASDLQGKIRLSVAGGFAREHIVPILMKFMEIYPDIDFDVQVAKGEQEIERGEIDIALITGEPNNKNLIYKWRDHSVLIPVASPKYIEQYGLPHHPEDLVNHFGFVYTGPIRKPATMMERNGSNALVKWKKFVQIADILAVKHAVCEGYGIAIDIPIVHCHEEIAQGKLIPILNGWRVPTLDCYAVTSKSGYGIKRIRTFFEWFVARSVANARIRDRKIAEQTGLLL